MDSLFLISSFQFPLLSSLHTSEFTSIIIFFCLLMFCYFMVVSLESLGSESEVSWKKPVILLLPLWKKGTTRKNGICGYVPSPIHFYMCRRTRKDIKNRLAQCKWGFPSIYLAIYFFSFFSSPFTLPLHLTTYVLLLCAYTALPFFLIFWKKRRENVYFLDPLFSFIRAWKFFPLYIILLCETLVCTFVLSIELRYVPYLKLVS